MEQDKQHLIDLEDATNGLANLFASMPDESTSTEEESQEEEIKDKEEPTGEDDKKSEPENNKKNKKQELRTDDLFELDENEDPASKEIDDIFVPHVAALKEAGVFNSDFDLETLKNASPEDKVKLLIEGQQEAIFERANSLLEKYVDNLPPKLKKAFETYSEGVDIDLAFETANKLETYKNIDKETLEEDADLAKKVLIEDLLQRGISKEDAEETVENMVDPSRLAYKALDRLIQAEEKKIINAKKAQEESIKLQERQQAEYMGSLKKYIEDTPEYIQGFKVEGTLRKKLFEKVTKVVENKDGQNLNHFGKLIHEDPIGMQVKLAYLAELTNDFKDFTKIVPAVKTNATKQLEDVIKAKSIKSSRNSESTYSVFDGTTKRGDGESLVEFLRKVKVK
jgi:hypothetical protein